MNGMPFNLLWTFKTPKYFVKTFHKGFSITFILKSQGLVRSELAHHLQFGPAWPTGIYCKQGYLVMFRKCFRYREGGEKDRNAKAQILSKK